MSFPEVSMNFLYARSKACPIVRVISSACEKKEVEFRRINIEVDSLSCDSSSKLLMVRPGKMLQQKERSENS